MDNNLNSLYENLPKEEALYELLKKECFYYSSILEITKVENDKLLTHQPLSDISPLLKQKKIYLSCIAEVEAIINPLKKYWQERPSKSDPISLKIKGELTSLDQLLREILQLDLISQKSLEDHLEFLQKKQTKIKLI